VIATPAYSITAGPFPECPRARSSAVFARGIEAGWPRYTPIDVVMEARRVSASEALDWLAPRVGVTLGDPEASALADRVIATAAAKKKELTQ
jgi:hypothetical protein